MSKFKILLISFLALFLIIGVVSAEDNGTAVKDNHPITTVIGGLSVSDINTASITFKDADGKTVSGQTSVSVNGKVMSASGSLSIGVTLPSGVSSISISQGSVSVGIKKADASTSGSIHADINKVAKSFSVILKDSNGNAVKNKVVTITVNGNSKTVNTDGNGRVIISVTVPGDAKSADISYSGSVKKADETPAPPVKVASKIKVSKQTFKVKTKTKKVPIVLKDKNNKPIKNKKVTLKVKGKTYSAKTNNKGKAVFKITKLNKKGKYTGKIKFAGDSAYKPSNANVKITVKK